MTAMAWELTIILGGFLLFCAGFALHLKADEIRCDLYNIARRADEQHAAILRGDYIRGSYGSHNPPKELMYLTVPDWRPADDRP